MQDPEFPIREEFKLLNPDSKVWCNICDYVLGPFHDEVGWPLFLAKWGLLLWTLATVLEETVGEYLGTPEAWMFAGLTLLLLNRFGWPDES